MIRAGVEIKGVKEVDEALRFFRQNVSASIKDAIQATALEALTDVRRSMKDTPKSGKAYPRQKGGKKTHIASSAGNPPAIDTGALTSSTYYTMVDDYTAAIGSRLDYAFYLEFGHWQETKTGNVWVDARPSWVPAAERAAPKMQKRIERIIAKAKAQAEKTTK